MTTTDREAAFLLRLVVGEIKKREAEPCIEDTKASVCVFPKLYLVCAANKWKKKMFYAILTLQ